MDSTHPSLLERLRRPDDQAAWARFVKLYTPLLFHCARRKIGLGLADASDLVHEVLGHVRRKMPNFVYDKKKRFRGWLWTVTKNKWLEGKRRKSLPMAENGAEAVAAFPVADPVALFDDAEERQLLNRRALELIQAELKFTTWKAFWEVVVEGRPPAEVAAELGLTRAAVHSARARVLRRLRQEFDGLWD